VDELVVKGGDVIDEVELGENRRRMRAREAI
jgi:hypothetical protein